MKLCTACRRHVRPDAGACPFCGEAVRTTGSTTLGTLVLLGALGASCTSRPVDESATGASTGTSTTQPGTSSTTLPNPTTSLSTTANSSTGELTTTSDIDTTDQGCAFYGGCPTDFGMGAIECDVWAQDCPPGEKCMPYSGDGDSDFESLKCIPVMENPGQHGDSCTAENGSFGGTDSCDVGHICWNIDRDTGEGKCVELCGGGPTNPVCDVPLTACNVHQSGLLNLCLPWCDPLLQECPAGETCIPDGAELNCAADVSGDEGQEFDPCEFANGCDPGLFCAAPQYAIECDPMFIGCCLSFCDLTMPTCNGQGAECVPWYDRGAAPFPGSENFGGCVIPE